MAPMIVFAGSSAHRASSKAGKEARVQEDHSLRVRTVFAGDDDGSHVNNWSQKHFTLLLSRTIDVVFNHKRLYANVQQPDPEVRIDRDHSLCFEPQGRLNLTRRYVRPQCCLQLISYLFKDSQRWKEFPVATWVCHALKCQCKPIMHIVDRFACSNPL